MASPVGPAPAVITPDHHYPPTKGTATFSYTCVALTGTAIIAVLVIFCRARVRRRAPVAAAGNPATESQRVSVDIAKLPELAYTESARRIGGVDGEQCSVCLGTVQPGEKVRRLPLCKHLYHVECIDKWLSSHTTCPLCRTDVEPAAEHDDQQALPV
jgi:hypothetical protein